MIWRVFALAGLVVPYLGSVWRLERKRRLQPGACSGVLKEDIGANVGRAELAANARGLYATLRGLPLDPEAASDQAAQLADAAPFIMASAVELSMPNSHATR